MTMRREPPPGPVLDRCREIMVDSLACAVGGRDCIGAQVAKSFPAHPAGEAGAVIGVAGGAAIDNAAFWNTAMIRYLDFNDTLSYGHPSDMIGALVAMSAGVSGERMLTAMAVAYEIFSRLAEAVLATPPLSMDLGYAVAVGAAAGLSHLLDLPRDTTAHAVSLAATNGVTLRASRAGELSHFKGAATAVSARHAVFCVHMARAGMTAPSAPFDGRHGIVELIHGKAGPLNLPAFAPASGTWNLLRTWLKFYPVAYNSQLGIWAALALREQVAPDALESVSLHAQHYLAHESGSEPAKWDPRTRETADHSLPYIFARTLRDGTFGVESFEMDKVLDPSLRGLMNKIRVAFDPVMEAGLSGAGLYQAGRQRSRRKRLCAGDP